MSDERLDMLSEMARNRGLKLVRSRVRTPNKRRFGKAGLVDSKGEAVFGMDAKGPTGKPEEIENYLRNLGAQDWGASLDVAVLPRKRKATKLPDAANDREPQADPKAAKAPKPSKPAKPTKPPKPPPQPVLQIREAKPGDAKSISRLLDYLGHPLADRLVKKNLASLARLKQLPLVATLDRELVGLCGLSRMMTVHRDAPVGRISTLVVAEQVQGNGIGRLLVTEAEKRMKKAGCKLVEVTSNDRRTAAHAFYRHLGYERTSLRFMKKL